MKESNIQANEAESFSVTELNSIYNPNLRQSLIAFSKKLPERQFFSAQEVCQLNYGDNFSKSPTVTDIYALQNSLRLYNVIPFLKQPNGRGKIFFDRDTVYCVYAVLWKTENKNFKLGKDGKQTVAELKDDLGDNKLAHILMPPDINKHVRVSVLEDFQETPQNPKKSNKRSQRKRVLSLLEKARQNEPKAVTHEEKLEYLSEVTENDLKCLQKWTKVDLLQFRIPKDNYYDEFLYSKFPLEVVKSLIVLSELHKKTLKPPVKVMEDLRNKDMAHAIDIAVGYLVSYPKLQNLSDIITALRNSYKKRAEQGFSC